MLTMRPYLIRRAHTATAVVATVLCVGIPASGQSSPAADNETPGRIDFAAVDLPTPTVEVDLSQGMFRDLFGIGDAAVAGVAETLLHSSETGDGTEATRLAAEQFAAARQIVQLASEVVREVRVRVYRGLPQESMKPEALAERFDRQLRAGNWDNVVQVREQEQSVRVSLHREDGAIQGIFIIAGQHGKELVLANVVCDLSPENVKKVTAAATKIGLKNGLAQVIESQMKQHHHRFQPPTPPEPPRPAPHHETR